MKRVTPHHPPFPVAAYLARIGLPALPPATAEGLSELVLAQARFVGDVGSLKVLFEALVQAYRHTGAGDEEEPGQFAQYLEWRSEVLFDEDAATAKAYWQAHLPASETNVAPYLPYRRAQALEGPALTLEAALDAPEPGEYPLHLERMQLTSPQGLKEELYQRLLLTGLKATAPTGDSSVSR